MRGQDELDRHRRGRSRELLGADPGLGEQPERLVQRLARRAALPLDLATTSDAVMLLGDVREVEVHRERPQDDRLGLDRERRDGLGELGGSLCVAASPEPGEPSDPFLEPVGRLAFLLDEDVTERVAEQPDVCSQSRVECLLRGATHRPTLSVRQAGFGRSRILRRDPPPPAAADP